MPKLNNKGFVNIFVIIAIAIAVGISGYVVIKHPDFNLISSLFSNPLITPSPTTSPTVSSGITGTVKTRPTCPVSRPPIEGYPAMDCSDKPYPFAEFIVSTAGIYPKEVARFTTNNNGQYAVSLPPGNYTIESAVKVGIVVQIQSVTVKANQVTKFDFVLDTGIR